MKESNVEKRLKQGVEKLGGVAFKFVSPGNAGVPDRLVILQGRIIFVELKTDDGRLSRLQQYQIARLEGLGQDVRVLYGEQDVDSFLDEIKEGE